MVTGSWRDNLAEDSSESEGGEDFRITKYGETTVKKRSDSVPSKALETNISFMTELNDVLKVMENNPRVRKRV